MFFVLFLAVVLFSSLVFWTSQEIRLEGCLWNELYRVEWDVNSLMLLLTYGYCYKASYMPDRVKPHL